MLGQCLVYAATNMGKMIDEEDFIFFSIKTYKMLMDIKHVSFREIIENYQTVIDSK